MDEYITHASECFEINLTRPSKDGVGDPVFNESFGPTHTYQFFGNREEIIGYKDPTIQLSFRANDMKPVLRRGFEEKVELPDEAYSEEYFKFDFEAPFKEYLPSYALDPSEAVPENAQNDPTSKDWRPPGTQLHKFALHGKQYEVWVTSFTDPAAKQIWENMQILPMLFIEGASLPELDADWSLQRWSLYLLYEVTPIEEDISSYTLAGFSTTYRFWTLPTLEIMRATKSLPSPPTSTNGDANKWSPPRLTQDPETFRINEHVDPLEQPSRERISQYLILPPYQGQSLGATLYETIFADLVKKPYIHEITVEDPDEAFDAMRDYSDIAYLRGLPSFNSLTIPSTIPKEYLAKDAPVPRDKILGDGVDLEQLRRETKIVTRQFNRVLELHLLSTIPPTHRNKQRITRKDRSTNEDDRRYYFWRLALKDRIYRQNRDSLEETEGGAEPLSTAEKVKAIEDAVDSQQEEYEKRLRGLEKRAKWKKGEAQEGSSSRSKRKRVVVEDDEDDEWEDMDEDSVTSSKRTRV
ncbi:acyl-CoA N-acyltransferase [Bimuria novae-zelandiae CBS 107.79]|uniref:Histone acetyltransferase type B catalytic subunit n=1 Tax=Bimuria novae-zelandiae CBS 107.79 TaxID=1447943 RepID=A0A6A5US19_9PLEO|nr:acyl-CoA N-acyltransferase [Bimuria novae-zelandiae CBS 107.79]